MTWVSIAAIYTLFWAITLFVVLPFGVKTHDELGMKKVPGQADSAPGNFRPLRLVLTTTAISAAAFGAFYANYEFGWIDGRDLNVFGSPPPSVSR